MIPIGDSVQARRFPGVNLLIIGVCLIVFIFELTLGPRLDQFVMRWGVTPAVIAHYFTPGHDGGWAVGLTLLTSQFLHAGWLHLGGNLLFLWIFGDNVEDRLGHLRYLLFYLICGAAAGLIQVYTMPTSEVPLIGASGAIAGVLGAYLVMYPRAWVSVLVPVFFFLLPLRVPVILMLGIWFLGQLSSGLAAITEVTQATTNIAFWAHIGGFLFGMVLTTLLPKPRLSRPAMPSAQRVSTITQMPPIAALIVSSVSLLGDAVKLLIFARIVCMLLALGQEGPLSFFVGTVYRWTWPLVEPFASLLPALLVNHYTLELYSLLALVVYHLLFMIAIWALTLIMRVSPKPQPRGRW